MTDIVTAVYELLGKFSDNSPNRELVREKVDRMFLVSNHFILFYSAKEKFSNTNKNI